jgi:hypothetical protein
MEDFMHMDWVGCSHRKHKWVQPNGRSVEDLVIQHIEGDCQADHDAYYAVYIIKPQ